MIGNDRYLCLHCINPSVLNTNGFLNQGTPTSGKLKASGKDRNSLQEFHMDNFQDWLIVYVLFIFTLGNVQESPHGFTVEQLGLTNQSNQNKNTLLYTPLQFPSMGFCSVIFPAHHVQVQIGTRRLNVTNRTSILHEGV